MRQNCTGSCLTMSSGYSKAISIFSDPTQNRSSFFYGKSMVFEKFVLSTIFYSGSIDHQGMLRIFKIFSNKIYTIFKVIYYMRQNCTGSCLTMSSGYSKAISIFSDPTQNRSSFFYGKSMFFEKFVLSTIFYSGSIDHQGMLRIFKIFSNKIYTIFKVNFY